MQLVTFGFNVLYLLPAHYGGLRTRAGLKFMNSKPQSSSLRNNKRVKSNLNGVLAKYIASTSSTRKKRTTVRGRNRGRNQGRPYVQPVVAEYIRSLHDPFSVRGVRMPSNTPCPTQVKTISGSLTFVTNAAGFARVLFKHFTGEIVLFNDAAHNESTLGTQSVIMPADSDLALSAATRTISYGLKLRSLASFSNEAGQVQAYMTALGNNGTYDNYRDSPFQHVYSKGQVAVVRYVPFDPSLLQLTRVAGYGNFIGTDVGIGFMISGAINSTYSMQYVMNVEYTSKVNTDLVPHRLVESGDPSVALSNLHRGGVNPANHLEDFFLKANTITRVGNLLARGYNAITNFVEGGNKYITS